MIGMMRCPECEGTGKVPDTRPAARVLQDHARERPGEMLTLTCEQVAELAAAVTPLYVPEEMRVGQD